MNGKAASTRTRLERGRSALGPALELVHTGRAPTRAVLTSELGVTRATAGAVAAELEALGPDGFLVNVGRGSVVDTKALIEALEGGRIAGAGLDVVEGEPEVPEALRRLPNVLLTPHMAGRSPETAEAAISLVLQNLQARFAGRPVLTPVLFEGAPMDGMPAERYASTV